MPNSASGRRRSRTAMRWCSFRRSPVVENAPPQPMFRFTRTPIEPQALRAQLADPACGGYAAFEGWVRDSHEGRRVRRLEYEAFEALAVREGERILAEAIACFGVAHAACLHRVGSWRSGGWRWWWV